MGLVNNDGHRQYALYRFYDTDGQLLYVGVTLDPGTRWKTHSKDKPWWTSVTMATIEQHLSRESALKAERVAIIKEHPKHNVVYNRPFALPTLLGKASGEQGAKHLCEVLPETVYGPDWGSQSVDMPSDCEKCEKVGFNNIYYPYWWHEGIARYRCARHHHWTCFWGHRCSGEALENASKRQFDEIDLRTQKTYL